MPINEQWEASRDGRRFPGPCWRLARGRLTAASQSSRTAE
jgi:hypothetical protein